jgi:thiamine biosynthesis protein ThiS
MKFITIEDQQIQWYPGQTLAEVVAALPDGHLYAVVRMNGRLVSRPDFAGTEVPDKAVIEPLPLVAGG